MGIISKLNVWLDREITLTYRDILDNMLMFTMILIFLWVFFVSYVPQMMAKP